MQYRKAIAKTIFDIPILLQYRRSKAYDMLFLDLKRQNYSQTQKSRFRSSSGSTMILSIFLGLALLCPLVLGGLHCLWVFGERQRIQTALDAAALQVANDIMKVTVNDPNFGFVAISNNPPIGKSTMSASGKPLPVDGYNTLVGTIRLDTLIANHLGDANFQRLARRDNESLKRTTASLNEALANAVSELSQTKRPTDWNGETIDAYTDGRKSFLSNISQGDALSGESVQAFSIQLGRASNSLGTGITIPKSVNSGSAPSSVFYPPFVDVPVDREHFVFACVGRNPSITDSSDFLPPVATQLSSIVRLEATVALKDQFIPFIDWINGRKPTFIRIVSSAKPGFQPDITPPGVLTVQFANGQVRSIRRLRDVFMNPDLRNARCEQYIAINGNYPVDPASQLLKNDEQSDADSVLSAAFYDWLRNAHCRPSISSIDDVLDHTFQNQSQRLVTIFEFSTAGEMVSHQCGKSPFNANEVEESQMLAQCNDALASNFPCQLIVRDEVNRVGTIYGGKEGGQPLCGDPVNWCELDEYGEGVCEAMKTGKGSQSLNIILSGAQSDECRNQNAIAPHGVIFRSLKREKLIAQPNPNFYSGGLAVDVIIGSP